MRTEARVLQERGGAAGPAPRTVVVETAGGGRTTEVVEVAASLPLSGVPPISTTTGPAAEVLNTPLSSPRQTAARPSVHEENFAAKQHISIPNAE